jgi:hypothetical protein
MPAFPTARHDQAGNASMSPSCCVDLKLPTAIQAPFVGHATGPIAPSGGLLTPAGKGAGFAFHFVFASVSMTPCFAVVPKGPPDADATGRLADAGLS